MFNACLRNTVSIAVVMILVLLVPGYSGKSQIRLAMSVVNGADSFFKIAGVSIFMYLMILMALFTMIGLKVKGSNRIRYGDLLAQMNKNGGQTDPLNQNDSDEDKN